MSTSTFTPCNISAILARIDAAVQQSGQVWANRVLASAQAYCPVRTGNLRASGGVVESQDGKRFTAAVVFTAPYAPYVEFGYGIRGAASPGAGPGPYGSRPGAAAQPFLRPAWDEHRDAAIPLTTQIVTATLR